ncbi:MAG: 2,3-bisphosphoglycerate-independent phosphoglycerate mutase [Thermoleophilaceae bacterium]
MAQARTPVFDELWERYAHATLETSGRGGGPPRRADGELGGRAPEPRRRGGGAPGPEAHRRRGGRRLAVRERGAARGLCCRAGVRPPPSHRTGLRRGRPLGVRPPPRADRDGRAGGGTRPRPARLHRRPRRLPHAGERHLEQAERWLAERGGRVGTVTGRYYAMDRDRRWERSKRAYDAIVHAEGEAPPAASGVEAVRAAYEREETDEFIVPTVVGDEARVRSGDAVIFLNFRPDRARQLVRALGDLRFDEFDRGEAPEVILTTMTRYQEGWDYPVAFPPHRPSTTLAAVVAGRGGTQLHVAETEKYAHVTYFFNGGEEGEHRGEEFRLVDSPRDVATYDERPEMSARAVTEAFVDGWSSARHRFGVVNFANPDMVGHTGVIEAAVTAIEAVDECLGRVVGAVHATGGACVVTADHGNADHMLADDGSPDTAHSLNPVPLVVTAEVPDGLRDGGALADVAPTVLALLGEEQPAEMTGTSLLDG